MTDTAPEPSEQIAFEYWSDPLCVWAFVSQPRLDRLLEEKRRLLAVQYRVVVVFGSVPWRFRAGNWAKAGPRGRAQTTRDVAHRFGREDVDGSVWVDDPPATSWAAGAAIKAAFAAEQQGDGPEGCGARYQRLLREAMFSRNQNVARRNVQLETAEAAGLQPATIASRLDDGSALAALAEDQRSKEEHNIHGSPTYVFDAGRAVLYGNFAEGILHATVDELIEGLGHGSSRC